MSKLFALIQALIPRFPTQEEVNEAYLAQSVDIYDLERRIQDIDRQQRRRAGTLALGGLVR